MCACSPSVLAVRTGAGGEVVDGRIKPMPEAQRSSSNSTGAKEPDKSNGTIGHSKAHASSFSFKMGKPKHAKAQVGAMQNCTRCLCQAGIGVMCS